MGRRRDIGWVKDSDGWLYYVPEELKDKIGNLRYEEHYYSYIVHPEGDKRWIIMNIKRHVEEYGKVNWTQIIPDRLYDVIAGPFPTQKVAKAAWFLIYGRQPER